jgi:hypothetical protein
VVGGEVGVEVIPPSVICAVFEIGGGKIGNNFVGNGDRVL